MAALSTLTNGLQVVTPEPLTGTAGQALTDNFQLLDTHLGDTSNPHSVTATQVGAIASIDGVSNDGGDVNLVAGSNVTITPDDGANTITIASSGGGSGGTVQGSDGTYDIQATNEGATAGNARGESSVDLQTDRHAATQIASGEHSVICGGRGNIASGDYSIVIGGGGGLYAFGNTVDSDFSFIGGGKINNVEGTYSTLVGGYSSTIEGTHGFIGGGSLNRVLPNYAIVCGGQNNAVLATRHWGAICGGQSNTINIAGTHGFIGGGEDNFVQGNHSVVCGGDGNSASSLYSSFVGGGLDNIASGTRSVVCGGTENTASGQNSAVGGGFENTASGLSTFVAGSEHTATANHSVIIGGISNTTNSGGNYSAIIGGRNGVVTSTGDNSVIAGGRTNYASHQNCLITGDQGDTFSNESLVIGGGLGLNQGDSVSSIACIRDTTTSASVGTETVAVPSDSVWCGTVYVAATTRDEVTRESAGYQVPFVLVNDGGVTLHSNTTTTLYEDDSNWNFSLTASGNNLVLNFTGVADTQIEWVATMMWSHVNGDDTPDPGSGSGS